MKYLDPQMGYVDKTVNHFIEHKTDNIDLGMIKKRL